MRLLVLSDTPFLPATAGNRRRMREMIRFLAGAGVEAGILLLPAVDRHEWDEAGMRQGVTRFEVAEHPLAARALARLRGIVRPAAAPAGPIGVDAWCPPWFRRARSAWLPSGPPTPSSPSTSTCPRAWRRSTIACSA